MDHKSKNAHHGGTAVVQLDSALGQLGLRVEGVPAEVDGAVAEVTWEISGGGAIGGVLHHTKLEGANEENNLGKARSGDGIRAIDGGPAVGEGVERVPRVVDVAREVDTGAGDDVSQEGDLGNASVLDLDVTEAVESLLVGAIKQAEGIEEAERGLGSELGLEGVEGRGGLGRGGGGKGSGRSNKGGEGDKFHHGEIE